MTPEEYLAAERSASEKHILWDGEVFAMVGASMDHNRIVRNVLASLHAQLRGQPCEPFPSDLRVWVPGKQGYVYPDVSVACDPIEIQDREKMDVLLNPKLIVEVLSESTEAFDRGEKFDGYKTIPSLHDYLLVASNRKHVDHYRRHSDAEWVLRGYDLQTGASQASAIVRIDSLDLGLALADVYVGVA